MEYVALFVCFMAGAMSIMHNVLQGGTREDGTHVETPQEAVDAGTPWALLCLAAAAVGILLLI
ncbi:MAG: hypothetical protein KAX65_04700 [Caldilineaceae bacterium]|nr:hypothetical protein [Caldilineaceae bacterium]